jgi:DNA mismatch endonuclease, patch repair protein
MTDSIAKSVRSRIMSSVRTKNTKPEVIVRKHLHSAGLRFRLHIQDLPGTPDIVLPKYQTVIFINGCFWHGHDCKRGSPPKSNTEFWLRKIEKNRFRDLRKTQELISAGWNVLTIWECDITVEKLNEIVTAIKSLV